LEGFQHRWTEDGIDRSWSYRLVECENCGLGFIDPMPDWKLLQTFYATDYHCYSHNGSFDPTSEYTKYKIARMRFGSNLSLLTVGKKAMAMTTEWLSGRTITYSLGVPLQLPLSAKILEIGYGTGYWLQIMASLGYENLYGYDIDANPTNMAKLRSLGVNLSSGRFVENDYPSSSFDCVRLEHVFEHLLNPAEVLAKCRTILKPGGALVMTFPCKASWSRSISSRHWGPLEPPVHLYHHTPRSARLLLEKADFEILGVRAFSVVEQLAGTLNNVIAAQKKRVPSLGPRLSRAIAPAYRLVGAATGKGDFMTVWAKR
jgi:SAM-dependent methyltransferase